jgi:hypothetical protein
VVSSTIKAAAGSVATALRRRFIRSPFHVKGTGKLLPSLTSLFRAYKNVDPPVKVQKAITPRLLKALFRDLVGRRKTTNASNDIMCHLADLVLGAFFFAMRACEYSTTPKVGRTRHIDMGGLLFRDRKKRPLPLTHPRLLDLAEYVTVTFERTKTTKKRDS